jgi:hypothetical protein
MAGNGRRHRRHSWQLRQRGFCNLQILKEPEEFESHPLRQPPWLISPETSNQASLSSASYGWLRHRSGEGWQPVGAEALAKAADPLRQSAPPASRLFAYSQRSATPTQQNAAAGRNLTAEEGSRIRPPGLSSATRRSPIVRATRSVTLRRSRHDLTHRAPRQRAAGQACSATRRLKTSYAAFGR